MNSKIIRKAIYESLYKIINEETDRTLIIYHGVDWDGYTSGAIALLANPSAELLGWNYNDELPDTTAYNKVILLDLTIGSRGDFSWMEENADKLIWIDHHANAISGANLRHIKGVRKDGIGACALTWEYFFGGQPPLHVSLCATYDVFRKDGAYADWEDAWAYQLALSELVDTPRGSDSAHTGLKAAVQFIQEAQSQTLKRIQYGITLEENRARNEEELFKQAEFVQRGDIKICKLVSGKGTPAHNIKNNFDNHTADVFFLINPKPLSDGIHYKISIRVPENSNVDASAIAREYGGNGHIKAAGCAMTIDEFKSL